MPWVISEGRSLPQWTAQILMFGIDVSDICTIAETRVVFGCEHIWCLEKLLFNRPPDPRNYTRNIKHDVAFWELAEISCHPVERHVAR